MDNDKKNNIITVFLIVVIAISLITFSAILISSCTCSVTMVHTEGKAQDVVDETQENTPSTSVSVPVSVIPK